MRRQIKRERVGREERKEKEKRDRNYAEKYKRRWKKMPRIVSAKKGSGS